MSIQAGKPTTTTTPATPRCTDAKQLQTDSIALVKPYLSRSALTTYKAKLTELVNTACDVNGTCTTLTTQVAQLRSIRGVSLPPAQEITLTGKEDTFLATYCAS